MKMSNDLSQDLLSINLQVFASFPSYITSNFHLDKILRMNCELEEKTSVKNICILAISLYNWPHKIHTFCTHKRMKPTTQIASEPLRSQIAQFAILNLV